MHPEKLLLFGRKVPYQLKQRKLPSKGLIVNPITNSADKSPKTIGKVSSPNYVKVVLRSGQHQQIGVIGLNTI